MVGAGVAVSRLLAFATTLHLARALETAHFGVVALATGLLGYAALMVDFGFDSLGAFEAARRAIPLRSLVRAVVAVRIATSVLALLGMAAFAALAPLPAPVGGVVLLYAASLPLAALDLKWVFLGTGSMRTAAVAEVLPQLVQAAAVFAFVRAPGDIFAVPAAFLAGQVASLAVLAAVFVRHHGWPGLGTERAVLRGLLPAALPIAGSTALGAVLHNADLILVGLWLGLEPAGLYGAAYRVVWVPLVLFSAYAVALRPVLVRAYEDGPVAVSELLARSNRVLAALAVGVVTGGVVVARPLMQWLYGAGYAAAAAPFQVLLGSVLLITLNRPYRLFLLASRREALDFRILLAAASLNVALNVLLIPRAGLMGAAAATVASEAVVFAAGYAATHRLLPGLALARFLVKPLVCAAMMTLVLLSVGDWPVPAQIALGGACYLALLLATRTVRVDEVRAAFGWRPAPGARIIP